MESYRLSEKADSDLADIYEHGILNFGLDQAQLYLSGIHDRFETLAKNPMLGRDAKEFAPNLRRFAYQSHSIFYVPQGQNILIVHVLRKEADLQRHL